MLVKEWLGLREEMGSFDPIEIKGQKTNSLVALNDSVGLTFKEIADVVESEPKGLVSIS